MDILTQLTAINYLPVLLGIFVILFGTREIIEIIAYFKKTFRIRTGVDDDREILENRISMLEKHDKWQYDEISKISKGVDDIRRRLIDKEIDDWRYEMLNMATDISLGKQYSKEAYDHILSIHERYEQLLAENNMTNGQVDASMEVINDVYKDKLKNGF